jgi:hypothetical protein
MANSFKKISSLIDDHQFVELVRYFVTLIELFQNIFQTKLAIPSLELKANLKPYMI